MKKNLLFVLLTLVLNLGFCQDFQYVDIDSEVTEVQPMTGIVLWNTNNQINTDAISLEYSYMDYADIVIAEDTYDWTPVDNLLDQMAARNHQAVLRFRFSYPGQTTNVPQYIKDLPDYNEIEGLSENKVTWFPDWTHPELQDFTLKFYQEYAARYDADPRLAFVQVGFGLWAEYHIYSGPFVLGETFPSKAYQKTFFDTLNDAFDKTYWSISIDAASSTYSPFSAEPDYLDLTFGVFDDSFMHAGHSGYNENSWNFFDRERYKWAPAGGEFSYYSSYDQQNVLNENVGAHGIPYEIFAQDFHITYINGNDQPNYHPMDRIKEASMRSGYKFKLLSFQTKPDSSIIEVTNVGVAPIYIDAFMTVNGVRSTESLKLLLPDATKVFHIAAGGDNAVVTIESDEILSTEEIQYFGTINEYEPFTVSTSEPLGKIDIQEVYKIFPTLTNEGKINIEYFGEQDYSVSMFDSAGVMLKNREKIQTSFIDVKNYKNGIYFLVLKESDGRTFTQKIILH